MHPGPTLQHAPVGDADHQGIGLAVDHLGHGGAVAERDAVAAVQVVQEALVVDRDGAVARRLVVAGPQQQLLALLDGHALVGHRAGSDLGSGEVDHDADRLLGLGRHLANRVVLDERLVEGAVGEADTSHVHPGLDEVLDRGLGLGGRTDGGDDLRATGHRPSIAPRRSNVGALPVNVACRTAIAALRCARASTSASRRTGDGIRGPGRRGAQVGGELVAWDAGVETAGGRHDVHRDAAEVAGLPADRRLPVDRRPPAGEADEADRLRTEPRAQPGQPLDAEAVLRRREVRGPGGGPLHDVGHADVVVDEQAARVAIELGEPGVAQRRPEAVAGRDVADAGVGGVERRVEAAAQQAHARRPRGRAGSARAWSWPRCAGCDPRRPARSTRRRSRRPPGRRSTPPAATR